MQHRHRLVSSCRHLADLLRRQLVESPRRLLGSVRQGSGHIVVLLSGSSSFSLDEPSHLTSPFLWQTSTATVPNVSLRKLSHYLRPHNLCTCDVATILVAPPQVPTHSQRLVPLATSCTATPASRHPFSDEDSAWVLLLHKEFYPL